MSLSKRTHIMLDPRMYARIKDQASLDNQTVGSFIRSALEANLSQRDEQIRRDRKRAIADMQKLRKEYAGSGQISVAEIRRMIAHGRRF
jgi:hypothetical protein